MSERRNARRRLRPVVLVCAVSLAACSSGGGGSDGGGDPGGGGGAGPLGGSGSISLAELTPLPSADAPAACARVYGDVDAVSEVMGTAVTASFAVADGNSLVCEYETTYEGFGSVVQAAQLTVGFRRVDDRPFSENGTDSDRVGPEGSFSRVEDQLEATVLLDDGLEVDPEEVRAWFLDKADEVTIDGYDVPEVVGGG